MSNLIVRSDGRMMTGGFSPSARGGILIPSAVAVKYPIPICIGLVSLKKPD